MIYQNTNRPVPVIYQYRHRGGGKETVYNSNNVRRETRTAALGLWEGLSHSALLCLLIVWDLSHSALLRLIVIVLNIVAVKTNWL